MKKTFVLLALVAFVITGCYWAESIAQHEVGLKITSGKVENILNPGRYTDWGWYTNIAKMDISAHTVAWEDPDLVTKDKQPIGLALAVTYRRDPTQAREMWQHYNREAQDEDALDMLVLTRVPRAAKAVTTQFTLDEMLGTAEGEGSGRGIITQELFNALESELAEFHVVLLDVGINNISPDPEFLSLLKQKANAAIRVEVASQEALQLVEELEKEKKQTEINLERARREQQVAAEMAKTFEKSDRAFELEKAKINAQAIGRRDKIIMIPPGTDLSLLFSADDLVPVQGGSDVE